MTQNGAKITRIKRKNKIYGGVMELERAISVLEDMCKTQTQGYRNIDEKLEIVKSAYIQAIETVLQALEELQQKEKSRIIGNINEIKIEDLEPILKPYYIPKEKVKENIRLAKQTPRRELCNYDDYTFGKIRALEELLDE